MIYERIAPAPELTPYIESYWLIDSEGESSVDTQKIIPDGFPEIIFHYGDPYRINLAGTWQKQQLSLLSGQIRKHFFLQNTGVSGMLGIKLMPAALTQLFDIHMAEITDKVISLEGLLPSITVLRESVNLSLIHKDAFIGKLESEFINMLDRTEPSGSGIDEVIALILEKKGMISVKELCEFMNKGERQLERLFSKFIGLSPKFYTRIIRLGHIFELMQSKDQSWSDLVYQSGFYDQSHFIKNFKEFTGEDPSSYGFEEKNMANFHLRK